MIFDDDIRPECRIADMQRPKKKKKKKTSAFHPIYLQCGWWQILVVPEPQLQTLFISRENTWSAFLRTACCEADTQDLISIRLRASSSWYFVCAGGVQRTKARGIALTYSGLDDRSPKLNKVSILYLTLSKNWRYIFFPTKSAVICCNAFVIMIFYC